MATFEFQANNELGQKIKQQISASNLEEAQKLLEAKGWKVEWIKPIEEKQTKAHAWQSKKVPLIEKANFCRYLATMLGAGLSLPEAVDVYARDTQNPRLRAVLVEVQQQLQQGKNLSSTLDKYPKIFDPIMVALIKAGELSGTLSKSLNYLADFMYSEYRLRQKVKGALMYPIIILIAMTGVALLMVFFVLPRMAPVFLRLNVQLPWYSQIVLNMGLLVSENAVVVLPITVVGLLVAGWFLTTPVGRRLLVKTASLMPAIRRLINYLDIARFCRTLSTLLASGVPINQSLEIVTSSLSQPAYRQAVGTFSSEMQKGVSLTDLMRRYPKLFPQMTVRMIAAGEKTGTVEDMLAESATYYENEIETLLDNFANIVEPLLLLLVGIGVGVMVVSVIGPIYSLVGGLQGQAGL